MSEFCHELYHQVFEGDFDPEKAIELSDKLLGAEEGGYEITKVEEALWLRMIAKCVSFLNHERTKVNETDDSC